MFEILKKYRWYIFSGALLLAAFIFYSLNLRDREQANGFERVLINVMSPVLGGASRGNNLLYGLWDGYVNLVNVKRENQELRESVRILNARMLEGQEALLTNERLKRLLDFKTGVGFPSVTASVIGEDGSSWFKSIIIDRGESAGLREGMPVVVADGVVGHVVKVAAASSRVLLLTDTASGVAGVVMRSRARGVVKGTGEGRCSLEFVVREDDIKVGDTVLTSGIGGNFPKGLPIGEVTMVKKGEYGIFQTIEVRPFVSAAKLEEVVVLLTQSPR